MFGKKKKDKKHGIKESIEVKEKHISETITKDSNKATEKVEKPFKVFSFMKKKEESGVIEPEIMKVESTWIWTNNEEYEAKLEKANKRKNKRIKKKDQVKNKEIDQDVEKEIVIEAEVVVPEATEEKRELSSYFEKDKPKSKKLQKKDKRNKEKEDLAGKAKTKKKNKSKHISRKERNNEEIVNQRVFKYKNKKYSKIEDFITYLNEHYLDIEVISEEVLDDENFFGWVSKNSGIFNQSLEQFKEIKDKIENKS